MEGRDVVDLSRKSIKVIFYAYNDSFPVINKQIEGNKNEEKIN